MLLYLPIFSILFECQFEKLIKNFSKLTAYVLGVCEEADLAAQIFTRIPNAQFSTDQGFLQTPY